MDVTICICTFGESIWWRKSHECLLKCHDKGFDNVIREHQGSLRDSRNIALSHVLTEYVIFLDADDELDKNYLDALDRAEPADVMVPAVRYRRNKVLGPAHLPRVPACSHNGLCGPACLSLGNYAVIGSAARTAALRAVGGFREWPMFEDWDLWLRVHKAGYSFTNVLDAIYIATWSASSRNRAPTQAQKLATHKEIARANGVN